MIARAPIYVPKSQAAVDLLVELQRARQGMAIVVDEYGGAMGVATVEDILEEIVGEIEDEHDEGPSVRLLAPGVWLASAREPISAINTRLKVGLPEGDYETLAGLLLDRLRRIPDEGEAIKVGPLVLTVVRATDRAVEEVEIRSGRITGRVPVPSAAGLRAATKSAKAQAAKTSASMPVAPEPTSGKGTKGPARGR